ncbi:MAG: putative aldolase class 2 protein [Candidatus Mesenet longicola]|uniref:Aldolase class 2 protein n=1 Tax=Candidatus Mesenet longicola TaxID=1892558 RepID=A0A8J3HWM8_9RICK|nr:MAG: putative aldolase class 2 protein [Candidatus Mesenet longicola]GHM59636.1 MAG: putative aldolase class 2 protein [Candidatus Mesenet longicola]
MKSVIKKDLAYAYQIISYLGLDDHTYTHLSARAEDHYYIYPFGMRFSEVHENCLMKISFVGEVIEGKEYQYNKTGYVIHGSIYQKRPDIKAIFHLHTPAIVAVASIKGGLLSMSQWALHFYNRVSYHKYDSLALNSAQGDKIVRDLKDNSVMMMENHGAIICGRTIWEAMFYTYHLEQACKTQCLILSMNQPVNLPREEICFKAASDLLSFEEDIGMRDWQAWKRLIDSNCKLSERK